MLSILLYITCDSCIQADVIRHNHTVNIEYSFHSVRYTSMIKPNRFTSTSDRILICHHLESDWQSFYQYWIRRVAFGLTTRGQHFLRNLPLGPRVSEWKWWVFSFLKTSSPAQKEWFLTHGLGFLFIILWDIINKQSWKTWILTSFFFF